MYRAKAPYNLSVISEGIAAAALMERKFLARTVRRMEHERVRMRGDLEELGFMVYPSETNFLLARAPVRSRTLCKRLHKRGIVIKDLNSHPRLRDHVRITLGDWSLNERLLRALRRALGKKEPAKLLLA
jgi:histidinol-phosphate aminotransferase